MYENRFVEGNVNTEMSPKTEGRCFVGFVIVAVFMCVAMLGVVFDSDALVFGGLSVGMGILIVISHAQPDYRLFVGAHVFFMVLGVVIVIMGASTSFFYRPMVYMGVLIIPISFVSMSGKVNPNA